MLKVVGFDLFIVDCEHGPFDYSQILGLFAMEGSAGSPP
jgi:2-keto-3-deoxy-L-rhamnonate aldolase RhmA